MVMVVVVVLVAAVVAAVVGGWWRWWWWGWQLRWYWWLMAMAVVLQVANITRGADESLARPTSRCRRTESIVSLERWVCPCAEFQVFSCYRG